MSATDASARPGPTRPRRRPAPNERPPSTQGDGPGPTWPTGRTVARRRPSWRRTLRRYLTVGSFIGPALLGIGIFLLFPLGTALESSLHKFGILDAPGTWYGLGNYRYLLHDPLVNTADWNTLWF